MQFLSTFFNFLAKSELTFEPKEFVNNLHYMGKGLIVIFVIIGVIILATLLINKLFSKKNK